MFGFAEFPPSNPTRTNKVRLWGFNPLGARNGLHILYFRTGGHISLIFNLRISCSFVKMTGFCKLPHKLGSP